MPSFSRQVQTKLTDGSYQQLEELAIECGTTVSELLREIVEERLGRPRRASLGERLALEAALESSSLLEEILLALPGQDVDEMRAKIVGNRARSAEEAERRIISANVSRREGC